MKELIYGKIVTISEQKNHLLEENIVLQKENEELKKKITELEEKNKFLESGISIEKLVEFVDKIKEKIITESKVVGETNV